MTEATAASQEKHDVRPVVRRGTGRDLTPVIGTIGILLLGYIVFSVLSSSGDESPVGSIDRPAIQDNWISAPPPLALPSEFQPGAAREAALAEANRQADAAEPQVQTRVVERFIPGPPPSPEPAYYPPPPTAPPVEPSSQVIYGPEGQSAGGAIEEGNANPDRVQAGRLANPSYTVPQGAIIAAVLETALDSTRPGAVRAIVSRDVLSFDGTRVLVPRGTRLYGEYSSGVSLGQKRALISWERLTRPDGVIMNLASPAADPLGRAGVEGDLDTHFFSRFGSAILQSVLDIGVGVATRSVSDDSVVLALPGSTQNIAGVQPEQVQPTLRVDHGASVSVFVARDLDFSNVDG